MYSMAEFVLNPSIPEAEADCICKLAEMVQLVLSSAFVTSDLEKLDCVIREYLCMFCNVGDWGYLAFSSTSRCSPAHFKIIRPTVTRGRSPTSTTSCTLRRTSAASAPFM